MNPARFQIVLVEPEIPQNSGNIGRTCVALDIPLHLVEPLGYSLEDKRLKRAGLDYWPNLVYTVHENVATFHEQRPPGRMVLTRSWGGVPLYDFRFEPGDLLVFGRESVGLSDDVFERYPDHHVTIPMVGPTRSLNLANSVAVVLFEGLRQLSTRGVPVFTHRPDSVQARRESERNSTP